MSCKGIGILCNEEKGEAIKRQCLLQEEWMLSGGVKVLLLFIVFICITTIVNIVKMSTQVIYGSFSPLLCILQVRQLILGLSYKSLGVNLRSSFIPHIFLHLILMLEVKCLSSDFSWLKGRHLDPRKPRERNGRASYVSLIHMCIPQKSICSLNE